MTINEKYIAHFGERLRRERERLGYTQSEFSEIGGVQRRSQSSYEQGRRFPDAGYLARVTLLGVDVQYLMTGISSANMELAIASVSEPNSATYKVVATKEPKDVDLQLLESVIGEVMNAIKWHASLHDIEPSDIAKVISMMYSNYKKSGKKPRKNDPSVLSAIEYALAG